MASIMKAVTITGGAFALVGAIFGLIILGGDLRWVIAAQGLIGGLTLWGIAGILDQQGA